MNNIDALKLLSDADLLRWMSDVLAQSGQVEWVLVARIAEVDARRDVPAVWRHPSDLLLVVFSRGRKLPVPRSHVRRVNADAQRLLVCYALDSLVYVHRVHHVDAPGEIYSFHKFD